jgi:sodium-coupled neutral amino acid transporter 7/8
MPPTTAASPLLDRLAGEASGPDDGDTTPPNRWGRAAAAGGGGDESDASTASAASLSTLDGGAASAPSSVFTLCNSAVGAGVLAMPLAFRRCGVAGGLLACALLGGAEASTLYALAKFAERHRARTYGDLVRKTLGTCAADGLSLLLVCYLFGSCTAYLVIAADCFHPLLVASGAPAWLATRGAVIGLVAAVVVFPLCLPRRLGALARASAAAVAGFAATAAAVVLRGAQAASARPSGERWAGVVFGVAPLSRASLSALPVFCFAFNCHANVVSVFTELHDYPELFGVAPRRRSAAGARAKSVRLRGMVLVIAAAVATVATGYVAVGVAGYIYAPLTVGGNVLLMFGDGDRLIALIRLIVGAVVVLHYPLNHHPARLGAEDVCVHVLGLGRPPRLVSAAGTAVFVAATALAAISAPGLESVLHLIGGTAAPAIIFFLPGLLLINAAVAKEHSASFLDLAALVEAGAAATRARPPRSPRAVDRVGARRRRAPSAMGLAEAGLIYSPRKSWWAGTACIALAAVLWGVTAVTTVWPPPA